MDDPRFDIVFAGETVEGQQQADVETRLAGLFKSSEDRIRQLFDGRRHVVKRDVDHTTAQKYVQVMAKAGAVAIALARDNDAAGAPPATSSGPASEQTTASGWDVAPAGTDLLREAERKPVTAVDVNVDHLSLASAFAATESDVTPPPSPPDTSHLSVAAVGAPLQDAHQAQDTPMLPDISAISLAEAGGLLVDPVDRPPVHVPDTSGMSLAPPGTTLDQIRDERPAVNPDTSGLSLAKE